MSNPNPSLGDIRDRLAYIEMATQRAESWLSESKSYIALLSRHLNTIEAFGRSTVTAGDDPIMGIAYYVKPKEVPPQPERYAIVDLKGHHRFVGKLSTTTEFGEQVNKIECWKSDGSTAAFYFRAEMIYLIEIVSKEQAMEEITFTPAETTDFGDLDVQYHDDEAETTGQMSDLHISPTAMSADEVAAVYNATATDLVAGPPAAEPVAASGITDDKPPFRILHFSDGRWNECDLERIFDKSEVYRQLINDVAGGLWVDGPAWIAELVKDYPSAKRFMIADVTVNLNGEKDTPF